MRIPPQPRRVPDAFTTRDRWLAAGALVAVLVAAVPHYGSASSVAQFIAALVAIAFAAAVLGHAVGEVGGRISPSAVGLLTR